MPTDKVRTPEQDRELLTRIRTRFKLAEEADHDNRVQAMEDMKFLHVPGNQWDPAVKKARGSRPCYEFNKSRIKAKRIENEMRTNRPSGKVRAVENADKKTADVMEGLGRNILSVADFDTITDYAGRYQVGGGLGAWRIVTEYTDDDGFDQDILPKPIANPFNLYWGPESVDPLHRDAPDWFLLDRLSKIAYEQKYGKKARKVDFSADTQFDDDQDWMSEAEGVRVCEYHYKEPYDKELVQLADGRTLDAESPDGKLALAGQIMDETGQPIPIRRRRTAKCERIMMCVASGDAILEGPVDLKGKYHRFVAVHGEWIVIDGKPVWFGLTRHMKDAQKAYNVASTSITETVATAPNSHYWVTVEQAKGNTDKWKQAITENLPFLPYNPDPKAPGPPSRVGGADVPVALVQEAQIRDQELKDCSGVYDAALGERSNEKSGIAISRREQQTQIVNFDFPDNMAKAKQWTVQVINDLIPYFYDTERIIRVIGKDGAEDFVKINTAGINPETGEQVLVNDLTRGKYDVTVTVGPSYSTQRQQAAETYSQMAPQDPALMATAGDLVYKSMDLPYADEIAERRRALLPPQIQAMLNKDKKMPPEVAQAQAQLQAQQQELQQQGQMVQAAAGEAAQQKAEADKAVSDLNVKRAQADADATRLQAELDRAKADLEIQRANFEAQQAKQLAQLAEREANLTLQAARMAATPANGSLQA